MGTKSRDGAEDCVEGYIGSKEAAIWHDGDRQQWWPCLKSTIEGDG
jgi:hypothetical protein